jgi:hypothetical protein
MPKHREQQRFPAAEYRESKSGTRRSWIQELISIRNVPSVRFMDLSGNVEVHGTTEL